MFTEIYDFFTKKKIQQYGAEVTCIGGQQQVFFEVGVSGMMPEHITSLMVIAKSQFQVIDKQVLGMTIRRIPDNKLAICMTFPINANMNDAQRIIGICNALSIHLSDAAKKALKPPSCLH